MKLVELKGAPRTDVGKKATKADRRQGAVPCVIYGYQEENIFFTSTQNDLRSVLFTGEFNLAEIEVDGKAYKCILKDAQFHPVTDNVIHVDFLLVKDGVPIKYDVPVVFQGVSPGVRAGGRLVQNIRKVRVKSLPSAMVSELSVSIEKLELGGSVRVRELNVPEGIEVMAAPSTPIANIEIPRALRSAAAKAAKDGK